LLQQSEDNGFLKQETFYPRTLHAQKKEYIPH